MSTIAGERTLENELREHNTAVKRFEGEKAVAMEAAETWVAEQREAGRDPVNDKELFEKADALYKVADAAGENAAQHRDQADRLMRTLGGHVERKIGKAATNGGMRAVDAIMATPEYQRLAETDSFKSAGSRIEIPGVELVSAEQLVENIKGGLPLFSATATVGDMINVDQRRFPPVPIPVRTVRILDLITMSTTESDKIDYVEEIVRTDAAAETALGDAYGEATYTYEEREALVRDIGHFVPAHRSNLADAGQVQGLLEGRLETGVLLRFELQVVRGNGIGQNMTGILNTDNIGHVERDGTNAEPILDVIHRGITNVRLNLFDEPDAIGLDPETYEDAVLEKATDSGVYLLGPASQATSKTIWGLPAVVTTVFPADTVLVGAYKAGAIAWVRAGVSVRASDSHEDFFTRRLVALLAEMRAAFAAWQPRAFCEVDVS
jgi:hypothetical protein